MRTASSVGAIEWQTRTRDRGQRPFHEDCRNTVASTEKEAGSASRIRYCQDVHGFNDVITMWRLALSRRTGINGTIRIFGID